MTSAELFAWRTRLGLSQQKAAAVLHYDIRTIQRYEKGTLDVPFLVEQLCRYLELRHTLRSYLGDPT